MSGRARALAVLAAGGLLGGCAMFSDESTGEEAAETTVSAVATTLFVTSPFCETMVDLRTRALNRELPDDPDYVNQVYLDLRPEVPVDIAADFELMLVEIGATTVESTVAVPSVSTSVLATDGSVAEAVIEGEGYSPDDTAAGRVQAYVEATCTGTLNNPGPPATVPP